LIARAGADDRGAAPVRRVLSVQCFDELFAPLIRRRIDGEVCLRPEAIERIVVCFPEGATVLGYAIKDDTDPLELALIRQCKFWVFSLLECDETPRKRSLPLRKRVANL